LPKPVEPREQLSAGKAFFSSQGLDVRHFAAIWHISRIAQLMETDLNEIAARQGISIADFHLLSALMMRSPEPMRATDLAYALNVTNAALSGRIRKLAEHLLLAFTISTDDRRSKLLSLNPAGRDKVIAVGRDLEERGSFARHFRGLAQDDREILDRILADIHTRLARDFAPVPRRDR
jgi:DNA-binding MarR family transcriptional regulator